MGNQEIVEGIKLFGTTITLHGTKQDHDQNNTINDAINTKVAENKKPDKIIPCPRCKSMDTKFCYFNNYNVNQPRHFCKGCQRYWTAGGALRNVPVGAGRRKIKPPGRAGSPVIGGVHEGCNNLDDGSSAIREFDLDSMLLEEWHLGPHDRFREDYPLKRRRSGSGCRSC